MYVCVCRSRSGHFVNPNVLKYSSHTYNVSEVMLFSQKKYNNNINVNFR